MDIKSQPEVDASLKEEFVVNFYTNFEDAHNRQLVAIAPGGQEYRFSEGRMWDDFVRYALSKSTFKEIEDAAYKKALRFGQGSNSKEWRVVQTLLAEFQRELEDLYGYID